MRKSRTAIPIALGLSLTAAATAAQQATSFDGVYKGQMTLGPTAATPQYTHPACVESRDAEMTIRGGYVYISYRDYKQHLLHYRGRVTPDGRVSAYHRNRDGSAAILTGTIGGNQLTGDMRRGKCDYNVNLAKAG
jgi:hypothetical protein